MDYAGLTNNVTTISFDTDSRNTEASYLSLSPTYLKFRPTFCFLFVSCCASMLPAMKMVRFYETSMKNNDGCFSCTSMKKKICFDI